MVHITGTSNSPNAIAVSGAHVWVADLNTVIELNAFNGSVVRVIKVKAQFHSFESPNSVGALAVAGGHVWVANLNTVVELNASNGSVVRVIDAKTDQLRQLMHIAVSGSHVWVLNNDVGDLVTELNASKGSVTRDISFHSVVGFIGPGSIATDNGRLWVTNDNSVIQLNASNGKVMRVIKAKADGFDDPEAMTADGPHLRVTNTQGNSVTELHVSDGSLARVFR
jgi:ligand-binding sensor domain-containing protein